MPSELAVLQGSDIQAPVNDEMPWTSKQIEYVRTKIISYKNQPGTDEEIWYLAQMAKRTGLDPFTRQIYGIKRWSGKLKKEVMTIQVGIDGLRLQAQRTRKYGGQSSPMWCGPEGQWTDVWLRKKKDGTVEYPSAAKVLVYMQGSQEPYPGVVTWDAYAAYGTFEKNGQEIKYLMDMWKKMPAEQLAKCAEAQALRKAAPQETSGLYITEEMQQADNPVGVMPPITLLRRDRDLLGPEVWGAIKSKVLGPGRKDEVVSLRDFTPREQELMLDAIEQWKGTATALKPPEVVKPVVAVPVVVGQMPGVGKPGEKVSLAEAMKMKLEMQAPNKTALTWLWCPDACGTPIFYDEVVEEGVVTSRVPIGDGGQIHDCKQGTLAS